MKYTINQTIYVKIKSVINEEISTEELKVKILACNVNNTGVYYLVDSKNGILLINENDVINQSLTVDNIRNIVCEFYNISIEVVYNKTSNPAIVKPRQIIQYFAYKLLFLSNKSIGEQTGGKSHATIIHSKETVNNMIDTNKQYKKEIEEIEKLLKEIK